MATRTGGLKLKDKEVKKFVNNIIEKTIRKVINVGDMANKKLRKISVIEWFSGAGFPLSYHSLLNSIDFVKPKVSQHGTNVVIEFNSYINPSLYDIEHTSLYKQQNKYNVDPFIYIVEDLQWTSGIIGLPKKSSVTDWTNSNFHQAEKSLYEYTYWKYNYNWRKLCNSYWKSYGNKYISNFDK